MSIRTILEIDGRQGEGGGQILRSSLTLSAATGRPFRIRHIRGGRRKSGLLRQHLTAARAAARVCDARLEGDVLGSTELTFEPQSCQAGHYELQVGSAGSCLLVLQTVLPILIRLESPSTLSLEGGTHNPSAPPFESIVESLIPVLSSAGAKISLSLERPGFFPAGGGRVSVSIDPASAPRPIDLLERGSQLSQDACIAIAHIGDHVAEREWNVVRKELGWSDSALRVHRFESSLGPGNALSLILRHEHVTEVVSAIGTRHVSAERVAHQAVDQARRYLAASAPVGEHLADQLMLPLALLAGGRFRTLSPSLHTRTNAMVIEGFLGEGRIRIEDEPGDACRIEVEGI
ncbi:MAG: RNA 3'-terminal phosphate cyclase [Planctomycetota bacterium]